MTEKVQFFEQATVRLRDWITESHRLSEDFFNEFPDLLEGETIRRYIERNAHRPDIHKEIINRLFDIQRDRAIRDICTL